MPFPAVPELDPGVIAGLVFPTATGEAGGHAHGAAGINQQNRQARARGHADAHRVKRRLVRLIALRTVNNAQALPQFAVQGFDNLRRRLAVRNNRQKLLVKHRTPGFDIFADGRIRQNVVKKNIFRNRTRPVVVVTYGERQIEIFPQIGFRDFPAGMRRHVVAQEFPGFFAESPLILRRQTDRQRSDKT